MRRECGDCTLCCRLLPVKGINKPSNTRCKFQRHTGCQVYHQPGKGFPWECGAWNCVWLQGGKFAADLRRPDHARYVVDVLPDYVTAQDRNAGEIRIPAVQIWCDPKYPDAHRDPALRAWLIERTGFVGLVRFDGEKGLVLVPPYMMENGEWLEKSQGNVVEGNHSFGQVLQALGHVP
jgi:hypothetical protein